MIVRSKVRGRSRTRGSSAGALLVTLALACGLSACSRDDADDTTDDELAALEAELEAETERADDAEAQLAEIAEQFPIEVTASLEGIDLIGAYTMTLTEAYCAGLSTCGVSRPDVRADIIQGSNGLELKIPNVLTAGLFDINGTLFAVTDSDQILDPCGATPRLSRVSTTIFADGIEIAADGTRSLTGLGASLLVSTDAVDECSDGVVFFAATLTPA